jgi:hypothetical protein
LPFVVGFARSAALRSPKGAALKGEAEGKADDGCSAVRIALASRECQNVSA